MVWNLAVFDDGNYLSYPGWSSKDSSGNAHITVVSALKENAEITFSCNEGSSTCKNVDELVKEIGVCDFEAMKATNDEEDDQLDKTYPCLDGEVHDSKGAITLPQGEYTILIKNLQTGQEILKFTDFYVGNGAAYTISILNNDNYPTLDQPSLVIVQDINTNDINMLWIIPQFFVITVAEVMISITGLEFAYTQAPISLKSVLTSFWLLTVSVGNIVVIIIAEGRVMPTQVAEYLLFAGLIIIADVIFILLKGLGLKLFGLKFGFGSKKKIR